MQSISWAHTWWLLLMPFFSFAQQSFSCQEIPVLCYHQVRPLTASDKAGSITISPSLFSRHMKMLHDSGYHTILPADLYECHTNGKRLPAKSIMITFDDNSTGQFTNALPVMDQYQFKAVFFVMTVAVGKKGYLSAAQIQQMARQGHEIGLHTWDHHNVTHYTPADWPVQLYKPRQQLEKITGQPVQFFAFPYGAWNDTAVNRLRQSGFKLAFILHTKASTANPQYTIRRLMVNASMTPTVLMKSLRKTFPHSF
jgi:peptidoglycan/xylan/chitin deacetylase (PgdA/CDA1 family)